ncbi:MAG: NRDE family protein [Salibacteraceae bacterium]
MCTVLLGYRTVPGYHLVLAANRDEFYQRSTVTAQPWEAPSPIVGGRDLEAGGTWMGITAAGRWAVVTNYREFPIPPIAPHSRGDLVARFLSETVSLEDYLADLRQRPNDYHGYNLLLGEGSRIAYISNRGAEQAKVAPGWHGLSNHLLDTPWPKVVHGINSLKAWSADPAILDSEKAFQFLQHQQQAPDQDLPQTGIGLDWERKLSALFIETEKYGTRCSSLLLIDVEGNVTFQERSYVPEANAKFNFHWSLD